MKYIFFIVILIQLCSCSKIKHKADRLVENTKELISKTGLKLVSTVIDELREPEITDYDLFDKFPELKNQNLIISNSKGIKCEYFLPFYKFYFKYKGEKSKLLDFISKIECSYSEIKPDSVCKRINFKVFEKEIQDLSEFESYKAKFFFDYKKSNIKELEFYYCIKTPETHFIIFDNETGFIYHKIENFRE